MQTVEQNVVVRIETSGTWEGGSWQKEFWEPEKMEAILHCMRRLQPGEPVDLDPDSFRTDSIQIRLEYADGSGTDFLQLHNQFLQQDAGAFCKIREGAGTQLIGLLHQLEGDD